MTPAARVLSFLRRRPRSASQRALDIAIGLAAAVVAGLVRLALMPLLGPELAYLTFFPATAVAAWAAGLWGGVAAVVAAVVLAGSILLARAGSLGAGDWVGLVIFVASGLLIAWLGGQLRATRATADLARERARFLADASAMLNEQLDPIATIEGLTRAVVPRFADRCAIDLFDEDGRFLDARIHAADPRMVDLAVALRRKDPYEADAPTGIAAVMRTGEPEYVLDADPAALAGIEDPERRRILEGLGYRSYISVPLTVREGRRIGVLSVGMAESGRHFARDDVAVAVDLGRRAAVALDHARLFVEVAARGDELGAVIRVMKDPVLVAGPDGRIRSHNEAAERVLGAVAGQGLDAVMDRLDEVESRPGVFRVASTGRYVAPMVFDAEAGRSTARIAVLRDMTDLLENEAARDAFIGMLSHELRTPITTIFGTAQMLRRPLGDEQRATLVDDLATETDRLYRLVEDLLVLSRFERGHLEIAAEPVLVQRVVATALARATAMHPGLEVVQTAPEVLPPALADTTYVEQILRNLLSNAVKYAGDKARIEVRVRVAGEFIEVEFEDDGPGISEQAADRVFNLYERLGESAFKPGAGIGLFVCRRLAEAMGGTMGVRTGARGGACFHFSLPVLTEDAPPTRNRPSLSKLTRTPRDVE